MNSKEIKHKIALSCSGNIKKYFEKVAIVNKLVCNNIYLSEEDILDMVENIYLKNKINLKLKTTAKS